MNKKNKIIVFGGSGFLGSHLCDLLNEKKFEITIYDIRKNRWKEIERAEKNDKEGEKIYKALKQEYLEKYMPKPDADPHGGAEDFKDVENPYCIPTPKIKDEKNKKFSSHMVDLNFKKDPNKDEII